jgi:hypothetical protein
MILYNQNSATLPVLGGYVPGMVVPTVHVLRDAGLEILDYIKSAPGTATVSLVAELASLTAPYVPYWYVYRLLS